MTMIHTIYGRGKCNTCMTILKCTLYANGKMQYWHHDLKSTLSMGGQNAIKHGTSLVEFDDRIKTIQGD